MDGVDRPSPASGDESWTVLGVLRASEAWLSGRSVESARRVSELLLSRALGVDRLRLYMNHDRPVDAGERATMRGWMARVGAGEPVAYVLGDQAFRGLVLSVDPAVLIPRPETEVLVDLALARLPEGGRFADLGTGSGAIALALVSERGDVRGIATDRSAAALAVARRNAATLGVDADRLEFREGDWWRPLEGDAFDLVVSNPPYVDPAQPELLGPGVAEHEPAVALLTPRGEPAAPYREIAAGLERGLRPGGWFVGETGVGAASAAAEALRACAFLEGVVVEADAAGHPRYLLAQRAAV